MKVLSRKKDNNIYLSFFWISMYLGFFLLPLGVNIPTPFFVISMIFGIIYIFKLRNSFLSQNKALWFFPLYFIITLISLLYTDNITYGLSLIERILPLFLFSIIFIFVKENFFNVKALFYALSLGLIISFIINISIAIYNSISVVNGEILIDLSVEGGYAFFESFSHGGSFFIGGEFSKLLHPSYVSMYLITVLVYFTKFRLKKNRQIIIIAFLILYLFLLASRGAILILVLISIALIFKTKDRGNKIILIGCFSLGLVVFICNPRVSHFYERLKSFNSMEHYKYATSEQSRLLTWDASIKLIKEAPLLGYGIGDATDVLIDKYKDLNYIHNYNNRYNAHNQFLQTFLQTGIIGFVFLVIPFVLMGIYTKNNHGFLIFLVLVVSLLFESMLVRFNGIIFFAIIMTFLLKDKSFFELEKESN